MKSLILIRHGKSCWDLPLGDHERPLKKKGITDAHLVSDKFKYHLPNKCLIYSSTAKRAIDTAKIFTQNLLIPEELVIQDSDLYTFDFKSLNKFVKNLDDLNDHVILFGHNAAITDFVNKFGDIYIENVPTSGAVFMQFDEIYWNEIQKGKVIKTLFPKELRNEAQTSE